MKTIKELEAIERTPKFENWMIYYYMALKDVSELIDEIRKNKCFRNIDEFIQELKSKIIGEEEKE